jgi:hypothetical protein
VQSQSNEPKRASYRKEKQSKLDTYLCSAIKNHGNHAKFFFHSYEYQGIQTKNPFDEILSLNFDLRLLKVNTYGIK